MKTKILDPRLARREAESRVCRDRGDDDLIRVCLEIHLRQAVGDDS